MHFDAAVFMNGIGQIDESVYEIAWLINETS
jgi:hypothetical protein